MRVARARRRWSTLAVIVVFMLVSIVPDLTHPRPAYAVEPVPIPLPAVEDPIGQQPEQSTPEVSIQADARPTTGTWRR